MVLRTLTACLLIGLLLAAVGVADSTRPRGSPAHAAALGSSVLATPSEAVLPDPFAMQRVFLPVERSDALKPDVARGALIPRPKIDFEATVQAAARVQHALKNPARLFEARYQATVQAGAIAGHADWRLSHPADGASAMPVDPLPGAIQKPAWNDGKTPLLFRASPDGKAPAATYLWNEGPGQNRFAFDWSTRLVEQQEEERGTLTFPAAPIATLELTLSADRVPLLTQAGVLVTGPFPAPKAEDRIWNVAFGGQTQLALAFRKVRKPDGAPAPVRVDRTAGWKLLRTGTLGQFDFALRTVNPGTRQLVFRVDAGLEIASVAGASVESWQFPDGTAVRPLSVLLREDAPTTQLTISTRSAAVLTDVKWNPPQIRLANGLILGDAINVQIAAEYKLEGWQPGDYRIASTSTTPDRTTKLDFVRALLKDDRPELKPPTIRIRPADGDFTAVEALEWRLEPSRNKLAAAFTVRVLSGPIPSFAFQASSGLILESASLFPDDPGVTFGPQPNVAHGWIVEPTRAVATGQSLEIRLEFRAADTMAPANLAHASPGEFVPLPHVSPVGAGDRKGVLTVRPSAGIKVSPAGISPPPNSLGLMPGFTVDYRGQLPDHDVFVTRSNPTVLASLETELTGTATSLGLTTTVRGRIDGIPLQSILVWAPGRSAKWQLEPPATANRLPGDLLLPWLPLLGGDRWYTLALAGVAEPEPGSLWRLTFAKPLLGDFTWTAETDIERNPGGTVPHDVSIPHFLGMPLSETNVKLDPTLAQNYRATVSSNAGARPSVAIIPKEAVAIVPAESSEKKWLFRKLQLRNRIDSDEVVRCVLSGTVLEAGAARLPISIRGDRLESVFIGGKRLELSVGELERIGLPMSQAGTEFEVRYSHRLESGPGRLLHRVESPLPEFPGDPAVAVTWTLGPEICAWPSLDSGTAFDGTEPIIIVKESTIHAGSLMAAIVVALLASLGFAGRRARLAVPITAAVALALGLACWLAPSGWSVAVRPALATALGCLTLAIGRNPARKLVLPCIFAAALFCDSGQAQAPVAVVVYVLPGTKDSPERFRVLVPKTVLERLDTLRRSPLPDAVILSADYECLANGDAVTVRAKYAVQSQKDAEQMLSLPLGGVRLETVSLDGREAFPEAATAERFLIPIRGVGPHELIVRFTVPVQSEGIDRDAKFGTPDLPVAHVGFAAGPRGRQLDVPSRNGAQSGSMDGLRVDAEQGGGRTIQLHWREGGAVAGARPTLSVKEGAIWDLGEARAELTVACQYRVEGGTVGAVKIEWPGGVQPARVSLESGDGSAAASGIRNWTVGPVANGTAPIDVQFQNPVEGRFTLVIQGYSTKVFGERPLLLFPRCADVAEADRDSFQAVRITGLKSEGVAVSGAIDFPADAVARDFSKTPEFNFSKLPPTRVVRRAGGKATELRPTLVPNPSFQAVAGEVVYTVSRRVDVEGAMRASTKETGCLEFNVPDGLVLYGVTSPELAGWARTGSRIQVWLNRPASDVIVRWAGQMPIKLSAESTVELPLPRWPSAVAKLAEPVAVRVRAASGWTIRPLPVVGLKSQPTSLPDEWLLTAEPGPIAAAKFSARPTPKPEAGAERPKLALPRSEPISVPAPLPNTAPDQLLSAVEDTRAPFWYSLAWGAGLAVVIALVFLGGRRWLPETFFILGLGAAAVLGVDSFWAWPFFGVALLGIVWRGQRVTQELGRKLFNQSSSSSYSS